MKRLRWQLVIVIVALVAIAILLLGQKPVAVTSPFFEPEPVSGGSYTEGLIGSFERLNPVLDFYNEADHDVDRLLYNSLVRFDDRGIPQAELAESWGISRDGTVYNFSLRPETYWHDGQPVTSADVIFTIELLRDPDLPIPEGLRTLWQDVEAEAVNELTIQFRLPEPFTPFMDYLTFGILPAHLWQGLTAEQLIAAPLNMQPVGSGPYRFERLLVEDGQIVGVALAANEAYFGGRPFIDQLVLRYYPDSVTALAAYQAGEIQGISQITAEALPGALKEPTLSFYTSRLPEQSIIFLNLDNPDLPFFQDAAIRRALLMGLNRQRMIDRVFGGQAAIADGPIFPNTWAYYEAIERVPYDPDQAIKMLKAAGYTIPASGGNVRANDQDQRLIFTLVHPDSAQHTALAEMIKADWEALGVGVILKAAPYETLISDYLEPRLYQAALVDLSLSRTPDPDPYPFWHQTQASNGQNYSMWNDRQASEYLEQARIIQDLAERTRLYRNFQVRFTNELPALPLFYPMYTYAVDAAVQGVRLGPLFDLSDRFSHVREWYLFSQQTLDVNATSTAAP